jgi:hypothetical protein
MRQTTTAEVRLDEGKAASSGATRPSLSPFLAVCGSAAKFRCRALRRDGRSRPTVRESGACRLRLQGEFRQQLIRSGLGI